MKITKEWLTEQGACDRGIDWFLQQKKTDSVELIHELTSNGRIGWAHWLARKTKYTGLCVQFYKGGFLIGRYIPKSELTKIEAAAGFVKRLNGDLER